jgi:hypothetical protein
MLPFRRPPGRITAARRRARTVACLLVLAAAGGCARAEENLAPASAAAVPQLTVPAVVPPPIPLMAQGVNVEQIYYAQYRLIAKATRGLAPQRPGVTDLYFVGFAGDAGQDVFLREIRSVRTLFDERFDTRGRAVTLVNNRATVASEPLASSHNLLAALAQVATRMDPDEDVLFLFLTTHGTPGVLAVEFPPLQLNNLTALNLRKMLDDAGIKWRVIVISACYSGSFIEPLRTETSLIVTASRSDRVSFGCSHENDFTYFGRAYFNEALRRTYSFIDAHADASKRVGQWESTEELKPSLPQIHVGAAIRPKLAEIEARLRKLNGADR